ncbi:uncharacterized protein CMC5_062190 [Chondromyces crocatus]|uniref:AMIN domain-containing protein n=2 Tax=Chondromyces crocatus TaxID=52 RepID=A0A0K1EMW4_CHOCO|nr:uncharacterized protein CMC5_062190 [Chondromyces crocatus]
MRATGKRKKTTKVIPNLLGPVATYPGFRMLSGGSSRVFLQVNRKVDVVESKAAGRITYRLKGTHTIQTNQYPLVTSFFPTPVGRVLLTPQGTDLDLVVELRVPSEAQHRVLETDQGMVLQVDFPAVDPGKLPAPPVTPAPPTLQRAGKKASKGVEDESY